MNRIVTKTLIKGLLLAAAATTLGLHALPSQAASGDGNRAGAHGNQIPGLGAAGTAGRTQVDLGNLKPNCPASFAVHYFSKKAFACAMQAPAGYEAATALIAESHECAPKRYWNVGPKVTLNTSGRVLWKCEHR
ncbi:hypothetical protein AIOL_000169 [Candidatus Rhodobacter oscarellae]|uniref:Uncharacterized protein n=1 Tax=Candidatus Rhodobacter oscarellae TaxID=1675527 RepID=A0A0J9EE66_9RHOB|nr:hypothetical protein [Candidatus Rhodobacter lobularis]KMW60019.1 hypothetical protein AIOL_000169 [Candidatus Rhodobacter lobularis]